MSNRLPTITGLYDGKSGKPLAEFKTGKPRRDCITFKDKKFVYAFIFNLP